jgi:hypothetical protein
MLTFAAPFAIVNYALIAQFDNYDTAYHREKQSDAPKHTHLSG